MAFQILALMLATMLGGAVPFIARHSSRALHLLAALATGLFLGAVFLDLLPETFAGLHGVAHGGEAAAESHAGEGLLDPWPGALVLVGVLIPFVIKNLILPGRGGGDPHVTASWGALFGLSLHALVAGVGLAAGFGTGSGLFSVVFASFLIHKLAEGLSISTVFFLSGASRRRLLWVVGLFALASPAGMLIGTLSIDALDTSGQQACGALAAGTFLFVALSDLLPEVFHGKGDVLKRLAFMLVGVCLSALGHWI